MYDNILVPTDGSDGSRQAFEHALDLAKMYNSTVHALYVVEPLHTADMGMEQVIDAMQSEGERVVGEFAERADAKDVTALTEVVVGTPHREILAYTEENPMDLIVMGTHGRTGLHRYLLGSVTEKVVRLSDVPVLTVRLTREEE